MNIDIERSQLLAHWKSVNRLVRHCLGLVHVL